jgi:hypothetical protein
MKPTSKPVKNSKLGGKKLEKKQTLKQIAPLTRVIS